MLQEIANTTGGMYYRATSNEKLQEIYDEIDTLERSKIEVNEFKRLYEEFYPFAIWALILLMISFILRNTLFKTFTE